MSVDGEGVGREEGSGRVSWRETERTQKDMTMRAAERD